jgi:selenocysteine-specific translation elongation factor
MPQAEATRMRHLTVGVFHDDALGRELGKKGTLSDIAMYNRKTDEYIFTFMSPVEDKLTAKSQIISSIDASIVVFSQMTRELGETVLMHGLVGLKEGTAVTTPYATPQQISSITDKTSMKSFRVEEKNPVKLLSILKDINPTRDNVSPAAIVVDHSFSVKGVGEVVLGFVKAGVVKKYDKLNLLPAGKEVVVRSIQVQDEDMDTAEAGTRVGLAIKGASVDEMERGSVLTASDSFKVLSQVELTFSKSPFYSDDVRNGTFHATVGMQTSSVTVSDVQANAIVIESAKPLVYGLDDTVLLLDLNAKKTRIVGKGNFRENIDG